MAVQIQLRRGTAAAWTAANPTLADGEYGYETDTGKRKIGDGATAWNSLAYLSGGAGGGVALIAGTQTATSGTVSFADSNGITFGMSGSTRITATVKTDYQTSGAYLTTAALSGDTSKYVQNWKLTGNTAGTTSSAQGTDLWFSGGNSITVSGNSNSIVFSVGAYLTTQSGQAFSADASSTFQTLTFQNSNGLSFSNNAGAIRITHDLQFTSATSAITSNALNTSASRVINLIAATNNTGGGTASLSSNVSFSNANGLTFYTSAGNAIAGSHNALTSQSNQAFSAAGGSSAFQTLSFSDNAVGSWTNNAGQVALTNARLSMYAVSNTTQSTSGTANISALSFGGAGGVSIGVTGGSVVISGATGGGTGGADGGVFAGVSNVGNTAGSTGTVSTGNFVLAASRGLTLSQSTGAAGSAATVTINGARLSQWYPIQGSMSQSQKGQGTMYVQPLILPAELVFDCFAMPMHFSNDTNSSGSGSISWWVGLYTSNVSTLSSLHSTSHSSAFTMSGTAGSYSLYAGMRRYGIPWTTTIQPGDYWVGIASSTASAVANMSMSQYAAVRQASNMSGAFGFASNQSRPIYPGQGFYTVQSAGIPGTLQWADINGTALQNAAPVVYFFVSNTL